MFGVPVKTRLPLAAWVPAALVALASTLSSLVGGTAVSVARPPVEWSSDVVKASFLVNHRAHPGRDG